MKLLLHKENEYDMKESYNRIYFQIVNLINIPAMKNLCTTKIEPIMTLLNLTNTMRNLHKNYVPRK